MSNDWSESALDEVIESYVGEGHTAICSSELFAQLDESAWAKLGESCQAKGLDLAIIMYVRDVYPFCYSLYHHTVKQHGQSRTFQEFAFEPFEWHAAALRRVTRVFGGEHIRVLHYDGNADRLEESFFEAIGVDYSGLSKVPTSMRVNRRLSREELDVLVLANRILGTAHTQRLTELMMYTKLEGAPIPPLNESVAQLIELRFGADVAWVNEHYFNSRPLVSLAGSYSSDGVRDNAPSAAVDTAHSRALAWAFREIADISLKSHQDLTARLVRLLGEIRELSEDKSLSRSPRIPSDFDPIMYLICNPDLISAGTNPYEHYLGWGISEGRRWRLD